MIKKMIKNSKKRRLIRFSLNKSLAKKSVNSQKENFKMVEIPKLVIDEDFSKNI